MPVAAGDFWMWQIDIMPWAAWRREHPVRPEMVRTVAHRLKAATSDLCSTCPRRADTGIGTGALPRRAHGHAVDGSAGTFAAAVTQLGRRDTRLARAERMTCYGVSEEWRSASDPGNLGYSPDSPDELKV